MNSVIDLIRAHSSRYPDFEEYIPNIEEAVANVSARPDRCIENCKALFEGISRSIILRLDASTDRKQVEKIQFDDLVLRAINEVQKIETVSRSPLLSIMPFIEMLRKIRNERGDVSHGRPAPKIDVSGRRLAEYILRMSETNLRYMLEVFYDVQEVKVEAAYAPPLLYEDNPDFNDWLDETNGPRGEFLYSLCLFHMYPMDYKNGLEDWKEFRQDHEFEFEIEFKK